jgi:hypothetical protein
MGALVGLIFGAVWSATQALLTIPGSMRVEHEDPAQTEYFWAILLGSALYYAVAEWLLEERDYIKLRAMKKCRGIEFWLRAALTFMFGVVVVGPPEALRFGLSPLHSSFLLLCVIYVGFLLWDVIVAIGGLDELVRRVVWFDFGGVVIIVLCLWTHNKAPALTPILVMIAFGALIVKLVLLFVSKDYKLQRFWMRDFQR